MQVSNPLAGLNISKAQEDTSKLLHKLWAPELKDFITEQGGSVVGVLTSLIDEETIAGFANQGLESFVLTNSRMENIRVWFNNKGSCTILRYIGECKIYEIKTFDAQAQPVILLSFYPKGGGLRLHTQML